MINPRLKKLFGFLEIDPKDPFTLYSIAYEYLSINKLDEAYTYFIRLKAAHPNYVGLYYHLGKTQTLLGQNDEAKSTYEQGIKVAQEIKDAHALGELQRALTALEDEMYWD